jgi:hypothetical protein
MLLLWRSLVRRININRAAFACHTCDTLSNAVGWLTKYRAVIRPDPTIIVANVGPKRLRRQETGAGFWLCCAWQEKWIVDG